MIEDGDLGSVHLDEDVVDAEEAEKGGEEVLDGSDRDPVLLEGRGVVLGPDVSEVRRDLDADIGAHEPDAVLGGSRPQAQADRPSGVEPDAGTRDVASQCSSVDRALPALVLTGRRKTPPWTQQGWCPGPSNRRVCTFCNLRGRRIPLWLTGH